MCRAWSIIDCISCVLLDVWGNFRVVKPLLCCFRLSSLVLFEALRGYKLFRDLFTLQPIPINWIHGDFMRLLSVYRLWFSFCRLPLRHFLSQRYWKTIWLCLFSLPRLPQAQIYLPKSRYRSWNCSSNKIVIDKSFTLYFFRCSAAINVCYFQNRQNKSLNRMEK